MRYETVIGLEVHCELNTESKIYCSCSTRFGAQENTQVCPICSGMPGMLPVQNIAVVESGMLVGLATGGTIPRVMRSERKHYFYPDLPKGFQTSQSEMPVSVGGTVAIDTPEGEKWVRLHHIHFEEDAGKLIHDPLLGTFVDLNRCGVPLLEIVSEPDMRSPEEARDFVEALREILLFLGVSDCRMEQGSLRCDVNVSVRPVGQKEYGERTEMKNINSLRSVYRAVEFESKRQIALLEKGEKIRRDTLRWDDARGVAYAMRSKEGANDYLYFPEPDLPSIVTNEAWIERIRARLVEPPRARRNRYVGEYGLSEYDASLMCTTPHTAALFEGTLAAGALAKVAANFIMSDASRIRNERGLEEIPFKSGALYELIDLVEKGTISRSAASKVMELMFDDPNASPAKLACEQGLGQISDEGAVRELCVAAIANGEKAVADYKKGNAKALTSLVGQVMKASRGKANPALVNKILLELLEE